LWGKSVATVPPRGNMAAGVAADAPGGVHLDKTGYGSLFGSVWQGTFARSL
jgi:hypothetical protein